MQNVFQHSFKLKLSARSILILEVATRVAGPVCCRGHEFQDLGPTLLVNAPKVHIPLHRESRQRHMRWGKLGQLVAAAIS